jgi:hypothetical protein
LAEEPVDSPTDNRRRWCCAIGCRATAQSVFPATPR